MANGNNGWGVSYTSLVFFEKLIGGHRNVKCFARENDICFDTHRIKQEDIIKIVVVNVYTFGLADYFEVLNQFPDTSCIVLSGGWNAYTRQSKEQAMSDNIGLLIPKELVPALWKEEPHKYYSKDEDGNPVYNIRSP